MNVRLACLRMLLQAHPSHIVAIAFAVFDRVRGRVALTGLLFSLCPRAVRKLTPFTTTPSVTTPSRIILGRACSRVFVPAGNTLEEDEQCLPQQGWGKKSVYAGAVLLVLGGVLVPPAMAQSWSIKSGRNVGTLLPGENRKLPDGSMYATGGSKVLVETEDPSYPITGQTMDCRWVCKVSVNAQDASCVTLCSGVDQNGDLFSFTSLGSNTGNYQVGPGTGKYVGATGGGTFEVVPTADPILSYVRWKGTLQLK